MVGFIISPKVIAIPLATDVTELTASEILEAIFLSHYRRSGPDLVLRASAGLPFRDVFLLAKRLHAGAIAQRFQVALRKSADRFGDVPVRLHEKHRRHARYAECIAGGISVFGLVQQCRKSHAKTLIECLGGGGVVLRDSDDLHGRTGRKTLQKRKRKLAHRTTDFVKREQHRSLPEYLVERNIGAVKIL